VKDDPVQERSADLAEVLLAGKEADRFGQTADGVDVESLNDGGLGGIGGRDQEAVAVLVGGLQGHGQGGAAPRLGVGPAAERLVGVDELAAALEGVGVVRAQRRGATQGLARGA
jgi:hypothetical protein